jgi:hypothetical protein
VPLAGQLQSSNMSDKFRAAQTSNTKESTKHLLWVVLGVRQQSRDMEHYLAALVLGEQR